MASVMNCPNCGASIMVMGQQASVQCEYCRSIVPVSNVTVNVNPAPPVQNIQPVQQFPNNQNYQQALQKWRNRKWIFVAVQAILGFIFYMTIEHEISVIDVISFLSALFINIACPVAFAITRPQPPPPLKKKNKFLQFILFTILYFVAFFVGVICSVIQNEILF